MTQSIGRCREAPSGEFVATQIDIASSGVHELDELVVRRVTNPVVVRVAGDAVGRIGEKFVDDDVAQRAAGDG